MNPDGQTTGRRGNAGRPGAGNHGFCRKVLIKKGRVFHRRGNGIPIALNGDKGSLFVAVDNVGTPVPVHVQYADLTPDAGIGMNLVRDPFNLSALRPVQLKPVDHGRFVRFGVLVRSVRPKGLSGDNVFQSVTVHINQFDRVQLRKVNAMAVFAFVHVHEHMALEIDFSVRADLFIPRKPVSVCGQPGDYIVQSVPVHIVDIHLCAATGAEHEVVQLPCRSVRERFRLPEPSMLEENVRAPVPIDITHAKSVGEASPFSTSGHRPKLPRFGGIFARFRETELISMVTHDLRNSVSVQVG